MDIFGETKFDTNIEDQACKCDSQGSSFSKHAASTAWFMMSLFWCYSDLSKLQHRWYISWNVLS